MAKLVAELLGRLLFPPTDFSTVDHDVMIVGDAIDSDGAKRKSFKPHRKPLRRAISEAFLVLRPEGKLVIIESCVPPWFYRFEWAVFPLAVSAVNAVLSHPATLQYPSTVLEGMVRAHTSAVSVTRIPKGR